MTGKMAKRIGDHTGAHLGQQMDRRAAVAAHGDGAASPGSGDGGGSMQGSSGSKKTMGSFTVMTSSSSRIQLRRAAVGQWRMVVARV
jgi:hypothetical protein